MIVNSPKKMGFASTLWLEWVIPGACLLIAIVLAFALRRPDFNWQIALSGFSAIDWVAHLRFPDRYQLDFLNGMHVYDKSSVMRLYPFLNRAFDIPVETIIPAMISLEMVFMAGASLFFARSLNGVVSPIGACLFALLVVVSPARDLDLSHFGAPFFWGLYYNFADGFRLLGVAFFLRHRPLLGGVMLGLGFSIHPLIALMGVAFVVGFMAVARSGTGIRGPLLGALAFVVISGSWLASAYDLSAIVSSQVDPDVWVRMARAFSYHFFPVDYGLVTLDFQKRLLPLLVLCLLAFHYLPVVCDDRNLRQGIVGGCAVLIALIALGYFISVYLPVPLLVKLALPRASAMLILIVLAIACIGLIVDIERGAAVQRVVALFIAVSPFVYAPGFPLIPATLLILLGRRPDAHDSFLDRRRLVFVALVLVWAIAVVNEGSRYFQILEMPAYSGYFVNYKYWAPVTVVAVALFVFASARSAFGTSSVFGTRLKWVDQKLGVAVVFFLASFLAVGWQKALVPDQTYRAFGSSYLEAQNWARNRTPEQSLFLVDPTIYYGWRDFSERSSFGNLREWLHTSWLYDSRFDRYQEGLRRFGEFGITLDPYLALPVSHLLGFRKLTSDISKRFYELDEKWFLGVQERYGVTHVVMRKDGVARDYPFVRAFENEHFVVFDLDETNDRHDGKAR